MKVLPMPLSIAQQRVNSVVFGLRGTLLALLKPRDNIVQFNLTEVNIHRSDQSQMVD